MDEEGSSSVDEPELPGIYLANEDTPDGRDPRTKVLSVLELEELFSKSAPDLNCEIVEV